MFLRGDGGLTDADVALAQALADVATVVIIQDQASRDATIRGRHLSHALTSRIAIEQKRDCRRTFQRRDGQNVCASAALPAE